MHIISTFLFAASANLDSFVVGLSYGLRQVHIHVRANLMISLIVSVGTLISMLAGAVLKDLIPLAVSSYLGGGIILLFGLYCLLSFLYHRVKGEGEDEEERPDTLKTLGVKETMSLGCALTVNNVGLGVGASIAGLGLWTTAAASFLCSLVFLYAGNTLGKSWLSGLIGRFAEPISGLMMVVLGLCEILG